MRELNSEIIVWRKNISWDFKNTPCCKNSLLSFLENSLSQLCRQFVSWHLSDHLEQRLSVESKWRGLSRAWWKDCFICLALWSPPYLQSLGLLDGVCFWFICSENSHIHCLKTCLERYEWMASCDFVSNLGLFTKVLFFNKLTTFSPVYARILYFIFDNAWRIEM